MAVALAGVAVVVTVAGREPVAPRAGESARGGGVVAGEGPGPVVAARGAVVAPSPVVTRARRDEPDVSAGLERWGSTSFDSDARPERLALARARQGLPIDGDVPHRHLAADEATAPEARAPAVGLVTGHSGSPGAPSWDGGDFWFGPNGLVRMREAQR